MLATLRSLQNALERHYALEPGPDVTDFVHLNTMHAHESVLVRQDGTHALELAILLPADLSVDGTVLTDDLVQAIEGVSHFVLLIERARTELPATQLELELQAEVDKFLILTEVFAAADADSLTRVHAWLFERVTFLHDVATEQGERYRLANDVAARLCSRLIARADSEFSQAWLRRFYRAGQAEKLWLAQAA